MTALVQQRDVAAKRSTPDAEPAQARQEFPEPRFPAGVGVPPAVLLVVLLGAAACLTAAGGTHPDSSAVLAGVVVGVAALLGFVALRVLVVRPVRRLRDDLAAALLGRQQNGAIRASAVREIDDVAAASRWYGSASRSVSRRRLPLSLSLPVLTLGLVGALIIGYLQATGRVSLSGADPVLLVSTALATGVVLLVSGQVYLVTVWPLRRLARQAESIAAARDGAGAPEAVGPQRLDEVGAITASLNRLLASVTTPTGPAAITAQFPAIRRGRR